MFNKKQLINTKLLNNYGVNLVSWTLQSVNINHNTQHGRISHFQILMAFDPATNHILKQFYEAPLSSAILNVLPASGQVAAINCVWANKAFLYRPFC